MNSKERKLNELYDCIEHSLSIIAYYCVHLLTLLLFVLSTFNIIPQYNVIYPNSSLKNICIQSINCYCFFCIEYFLIKCKNTAKNKISFRYYSFKRTGYCKICCKEKYLRVHHCRTCNSCTLRMDHHCSWMNCCIGLHNIRYFYLFLLYGSIITITNFIKIVLILYYHSLIPNFSFVLSLIGLLISFSCGISLLILLLIQTIFISFNCTTIECLQFISSLRSGVLFINKFKKSLWKNWCEAFLIEDYQWQLPIKFLPFN
ncbi:zinc finger protein DHHC domain containing protein, putative [Entamoeba dispar SAW760]|uniref:Palmitoyltransferase n=1 Tax=Entamoeba dispar (strain ATCC PRA-260 / SAW760) TaxID=370354 RepID=B0E6P5_ENTDS|nr:zinc finger protein DHHC domain containing protein, putative [Entamoeba dispar SAW760]EDR29799.1 zinc finger protein DHHC domain containing protein, putative [Entamoeba dispar SAW760]|eukprot:EDR29799.1 zinc finger protein DHHC domain containing protein, putative [Entamoeba dispar SAW760]